MKYDFYSEEQELLECWLDKVVFSEKLKLTPYNTASYEAGPVIEEIVPIELIVRPECNQYCKYCYISQHGKELYPIEERVSNGVILNNLDNFLTYVFEEKKTFVNHWELFAGDMFYDGLFFDICEIFYKHIKSLYYTYRHLFTKEPFLIIIPCNCAFVQDDEKVKLYDEWINKFAQIGTRVIISYSGDGKYAVDAREQTDKIDDAYYDKLFKFLIKHDYLCHPMIAPENIDNAIKNYDWWVEQCQKYYVPYSPKDVLPMFLEVRNDYWTEDKLEKYRQLLDHMIQDRLRMCDYNIDDLAWHLFSGNGAHGTLPSFEQNDLIHFIYTRDDERNNQLPFRKMSCSFQSLVHITLNNLSIVPCHRTTYSQFVAGKFEQDENGKIIGVIPHNVSFFLVSKYAQPNFYPKCVHCILNRICQKGCIGAQFETNAEIYQPAISVCEMFKAKYMFTIYKLVEMGVIESAKTQDILPEDEYDYYNMLHDEWLALDAERKRGCHCCE